MSRKDTDKFFIADMTYEHMLKYIGGFVAYNEAILSLPESINSSFIPKLHSNQRSLENFFSRI